MNDLERILRELREERDCFRELVQKFKTREFEFEVWDDGNVVANDLESLLELVEVHGYLVKRGGIK